MTEKYSPLREFLLSEKKLCYPKDWPLDKAEELDFVKFALASTNIDHRIAVLRVILWSPYNAVKQSVFEVLIELVLRGERDQRLSLMAIKSLPRQWLLSKIRTSFDLFLSKPFCENKSRRFLVILGEVDRRLVTEFYHVAEVFGRQELVEVIAEEIRSRRSSRG